jgi:transposase-like protein
MNIIEISEKFPAEIDCIKHFEQARWGDTITCPYCFSIEIWDRAKDLRLHCKSCKKSFSVTTNTHLHNTRLPLKKWMFAFSIVSDAKKGLSAMQMQRNLNIMYPTAWAMYHKIREIMSIENNEVVLDDVTESDSTYIGGKPRKCQSEAKGTPKHIPELDELKEKYETKGYRFKEGKYKKPCKIGKQPRGRGTDKSIVTGVIERGGDVFAEVVKNTNFSELKKIIDKHVQTNKSVMIMDKDTSNVKLSKLIDSVVIDHSKMYSYRGLNSNSIESFWAIIKRQIMGQHHHVSPEYLNNYVQETVFKYNNRKVDDMFETLVKLSMGNSNSN